MFIISIAGTSFGQKFVPNYDESKIPAYHLPEIIPENCKDKPEQWRALRANWLTLIEKEVYGSWDCQGYTVVSQIVEHGDAFNGKADRIQYEVTIANQHGSQVIDLLLYLPKIAGSGNAVPIFLGLNFAGNHASTDDPQVRLPKSWLRNDNYGYVVDHHATENGRNQPHDRWPYERIIDAGFGVATAYYGDIAPDDPEQFPTGLPRLSPDLVQGPKQPTTGGAIAVWSWGLSRLLDVLAQNERIDGGRVAVIGHSRLGKTSLWAGAKDERFALVISNNSGCGGAALSRRAFGETVERINTSFPHWFAANYRKYNLKEDSCPVDQHTLLAMIAPRPLYVASASKDEWADPKGELVSSLEAGPVYSLLGKVSLPAVEFPKPNSVIYKTGVRSADAPTEEFAQIGYHLRDGEHALSEWDWVRYLEFAKQHLKK